MRLEEKAICAPPRLSEVSPALPLKRFQCSSDRRWPSLVLSRKIVKCFYHSVTPWEKKISQYKPFQCKDVALILKGDGAKDTCLLAWRRSKCANNYFPRQLPVVFLSIFVDTVWLRINLSSSGCSHVGSLFAKEEKKRLARDVFVRPWSSCHWHKFLGTKSTALTVVLSRFSNVDLTMEICYEFFIRYYFIIPSLSIEWMNEWKFIYSA